MKSTKIQDYSTEQLTAQKKTLMSIVIIMAVLIVLYAAYFIYRIVTRTWDSTPMLGSVMLGLLVVVVSMNSIRMAVIDQELRRRKV